MTIEEITQIIKETRPPKFHIGDVITSKKTGLPGIGKIYAIMPAITYVNLTGYKDHSYWNQFPDWQMEHVYIVLYEEPRPISTFEEWKRYITPEKLDCYVEGGLEKIYHMEIPKMSSITYPEQDLELF